MSYTYEKVENELLQEGDYEVEIADFAKKEVPTTRTEKISVSYRIRDDVEQNGKNRYVFEDIWKEKENLQFFNRKRLNKLLGTQTIEDGHVFESIEDIGNFLKGAFLIVHVVKEMDEYRGEEINRVAYYKPTKQGAQSLTPAPKKEAKTAKKESIVEDIDVVDDELPF